MWMTWSFRDRQRRRLMLLALMVCAGSFLATAQSQVAPDSPRPARGGIQEHKAGPPKTPATVELKAVVVRRLDEKTRKLADPQFLKEAEEPLYVEVKTQASLGNLARSSLPVIVVNGSELRNTRAMDDHTLVAFLPNLKMLKDANTVAVVWLGDPRTRTQHPLTFALKEIAR